MSRENVKILRAIFEIFPGVQEQLRVGTFPIEEPFAEDVEWDASLMGLPDVGSGVYRGREGVRQFWMDWLAAWDNVSFDFELVDAGEHVVALLDQRMRSSRIDFPVGEYAQVFRFSKGLVVAWKLYPSQTEALEAVGLRE